MHLISTDKIYERRDHKCSALTTMSLDFYPFCFKSHPCKPPLLHMLHTRHKGNGKK